MEKGKRGKKRKEKKKQGRKEVNTERKRESVCERMRVGERESNILVPCEVEREEQK